MTAKIDGRTTDTKQRILKEAKRMYLKGGYAGISLQELAAHLEISKPALFHHFKSKQDLFYGVLLDLCEDNQQQIAAAIAEGQNVRGRMRNILLAMAQLPFFDPMKFLNEELEELREEQQNEIERYYYQGMQAPILNLLEEGIRSGELRPHNPRVGALAFTNLMMLLPSPGSPIVVTLDESKQEEYIDELLQLFYAGVASQP